MELPIDILKEFLPIGKGQLVDVFNDPSIFVGIDQQSTFLSKFYRLPLSPSHGELDRTIICLA